MPRGRVVVALSDGEGQDVVAVLRASGLGDLITAAPAIRALARAQWSRTCVVATPAWLGPVVHAIDAPLRLLPHDGLAPIASETSPTVAVNLHGSGPESHRVLLATDPDRLLAYAHPDVPESWDGPCWERAEHEIHRWCRLVEHFGIEVDPGEPALCRPPPLPGAWEDVVVVHPGAASEARRWPSDRWAQVARMLVDAGHRVVVTGTASEAARVRVVAGDPRCPSIRALIGAGLVMLMRLVAHARLVCSGDTGVSHLADALGVPSVTLFGPVSPDRWGPLPGREGHVALWAGREGDPHAPVVDPGLLALGVSDVMRAIGRLLR